MKKKIFVVEGAHDEARLKQIFPGINTISVGGSQVKKDVLDLLIQNEETLDIVLLFDPDAAGENIRRKVSRVLKNPKHIFFDQKDAISSNRKKIGIEHIKRSLLEESINNEITESKNKTDLSMGVLVELGLAGGNNATENRTKLTSKFNIGHANAKTLLQRLNWLGITKSELEEIIYGTSS